MLLTLSAASFRKRLAAKPASGGFDLLDLPRFARDHLGLYGLNVHTDLLAGADLARLTRLHEAADKAGCPCLVLIEAEPQPLGTQDDARGDAAIERMRRVVHAGSRLGCNSVAMTVVSEDDEAAFDLAAERLKRIVTPAEKLELNVLVMAGDGLTSVPDRLTDLIKKVGGFRIGTFPDFETASKTEDPLHHLRRLVPYASALSASSVAFEKSPEEPGFVHRAYDLGAFCETVTAVGYSGTLGIEYRGRGDAEEGVIRTRTILAKTLGLEDGA